MKYFKRLLGIICLLVMGFITFCAATGFGILIAMIVVIFPTWQIVLGTLLGAVGVFLHLTRKKV